MYGTYYARVGQAMALGPGDRLIGVTGRTQGNLLRVVDVDINGNPIGEPTYLPANVPQVEMILKDGILVEARENDEQEIDWSAHESNTGRIDPDTGEVEEESQIDFNPGPVNPMLGALGGQ
jgi:hypothetical protein